MRHAWATAWAGLAAIAVVVGLASWWGTPPSVVPREADAAGGFSAERALDTLEGLIGDVGPHALGTPGAREVEGRLVRAVRGLGLHPEVTPRVVCVQDVCTRVRNVVARLPGRDPTAPHLIVNTHYDSVRAGPGWGDDGAGVAAALEAARVLSEGEPLARDVVFLWNEGEELGLWGARAFVEGSPHADDVHAVVNLEARGVRGRSYLFEMAGPTSGLARAYASGARAPAGSSLYVSIYRMLPNGTDVTVFGDAGLRAANLAFLDGGTHYHTPLDDRAHLDPRSVQHHGEQLLGLLRGLDRTDLDVEGDDVFFDVLGLFVARWPVGWTIGLAGGTALVLLGLVVALLRRAKRTLWGGPLVLGVLLLPALAAGLGWAADTVLTTLEASWHTGPDWLTGGLSLGVLGLTLATGGLLGRAGRDAVWCAVAVVHGILAVVLAVLLPGGAFLGLLPAWGAGVALSTRLATRHPLAHLVGDGLGVLPATVLAHLALNLPGALGEHGLIVAAPLGLAGAALLPWLAPLEDGAERGTLDRAARLGAWSLPLGGGVLLLAGLGLLAVVPTLPVASPERPQGLRVRATTTARGTVLQAVNATWPRPGPLPATWSDPTPLPVSEATPRAQVTSDGDGALRVHAPGADELLIDPGAGPLTVEGVPRTSPRIQWIGAAPNGLRIGVSGAVEAVVVQHTRSGLPPGAPELPEGWVPIHGGIRHAVRERLDLLPR